MIDVQIGYNMTRLTANMSTVESNQWRHILPAVVSQRDAIIPTRFGLFRLGAKVRPNSRNSDGGRDKGRSSSGGSTAKGASHGENGFEMDQLNDISKIKWQPIAACSTCRAALHGESYLC